MVRQSRRSPSRRSLDGGFTLPASAGTAAHWPSFPAGSPSTRPLTPLRSRCRAIAHRHRRLLQHRRHRLHQVRRGPDDRRLAGASRANGWARLYTRLFGVDAVQQRGDGQGRQIPASGPLEIYLTDPLGLHQPGMLASEIHRAPRLATLNFDMVVVLPNGNARIYGGLATNIAAGPTAAPSFALRHQPDPRPRVSAGHLPAGILGLGSALEHAAPDHAAGWVQLLTGEGNPRDAPRFPTMARRELLAAGFNANAWTGCHRRRADRARDAV